MSNELRAVLGSIVVMVEFILYRGGVQSVRVDGTPYFVKHEDRDMATRFFGECMLSGVWRTSQHHNIVKCVWEGALENSTLVDPLFRVRTVNDYLLDGYGIEEARYEAEEGQYQ